MASIYEVRQLLNKYNISESDNADQFLDFFTQFSKEDLEKYLKGCVFLKQELNNACTTITLQQVYYIIATSNRKLLKSIKDEFDAMVNSTSLDQDTAKTLFKSISKDVLSTVEKSDKEITTIAERFIADLNKVKEISSSFKSHLDEDIATKLYTNCLKRMQTFYTATNPAQLQNLIYYLLNNIEGINKPKTEDLLYISERCASFYSNATAEKVELISQQLSDFANFIYNKFDAIKNPSNALQIMQYQNELKAKDLRNILLFNPTIFTENPTTINFNIDLIKGNQTIGDLFSKYSLEPTHQETLEKFKNISLTFSPIDMQKLYTGNLSALSTSPNVLLNTLQFIDVTAKKIFKNEISPEEYLSPDTFAQVQMLHKIADTSNSQEYNQWQNNLTLLSKIVSRDKLKEYFLSNFKLATVPTDFIKKQITETILSSETSEELEAKFDRLISKNFFWDVSNKDTSKNAKTTSTIEVPKYRVGNKKNDPIAFGLDVEKAAQFLATMGYNQEVINAWIENQTKQEVKDTKKKTKTDTLDIATINHCNEILNLIRNINSLLDTKPDIPTLYRVNQDLAELFIAIQSLSSNTRSMNTSTKGLIVNVKNSFNDLSNRYNSVISKIQQATRDEYRKLNKQYSQLSNQINEQYAQYQKYKNNIPAILQDFSDLQKQKSQIIKNIRHFQDLQDQNITERFDRINKYSARVQEYYSHICSWAEQCLDQQLIATNPADHINLFPEVILDENKKYLFSELNINHTNRFTGEIFLVLKQIQQNPKFASLYSAIRADFAKHGIYLDVQLSHTQPENFHGDMLSDELVISFLGDEYNDENRETIVYYNGILNTAWRTQATYEAKIKAEEASLKQVKEKIAQLQDIIDHGFSNKQQGMSNNKELERLQKEKQRLQEQLEELKNMHFNR